MKRGIKHADNVSVKIRQWFLDNRDDELTIPDMVIKFGCSRSLAFRVLREMRAEGIAELVQVARYAKGVMR